MIYITQPTYLPWIGYFSFLDKAEEIVFLDDVQFSKRSWQQRNKIFLNNDYQYLTVPVESKGKSNQLINEVKIFDNLFFNDHLKFIKHSYRRATYFSEIFDLLQSLNNKISLEKSILNINILLIKKLCEYLKIEIKYSKSSELNINKKKSDKLIEICKVKFKYKLMSNEGTIDYMTKDTKKFEKDNIDVIFFKYNNIEYKQLTKKFIQQLSIIDLLFNEGPNSVKIIRDGLEKINI